MQLNKKILIMILVISLVGTVHAECIGFQCNVIRFMSHGIINVFVPNANADVYSASLPGSMTNVSSEVFNHLWGMSIIGNQIIDYVKEQTDVNKGGTAFYKAAKKINSKYLIINLVGKDDPLKEIKKNIENFKFLVPSKLGVSEDEVKKLIDVKIDYKDDFYAPWWYDDYKGTERCEKCAGCDDCEKNHGPLGLLSHIDEKTGKYHQEWHKYSNVYGKQPSLNINYTMDVLVKGKPAKYYYFIAKYSGWNIINSLLGNFYLDTIKTDDLKIKDMKIERKPFSLLFRINDYPVILNCTTHDGEYFHFNDPIRYNLKCSNKQLYSCGVPIKGLKGDPCDTADKMDDMTGLIKEYGCPPTHTKEDHLKEYDSKSDASIAGCNLNYLCGLVTSKISNYPAEARFCIDDYGNIIDSTVSILDKNGWSGSTNCDKKWREIDCVYYKKGDYKFSVVHVDKSGCTVKLAASLRPSLVGNAVFINPEADTYTFKCGEVLKENGYKVDGNLDLDDICCYAVGGVVMHTKDCKSGNCYFCKGDGYCDCDNGEKTINSPDCHACECKYKNENGCWIGGDCRRVNIGRTYQCHKCVGPDEWEGVGKCNPNDLCLPCDRTPQCNGCTWTWKVYTPCSASYSNNYCNLNIRHKRSTSINCCSCTQESQTVSCTGCCSYNNDGTCANGEKCNNCQCYC